MNTTLSLFQTPLERAFRDFHASNPHVYSDIVREARTLRRAGLAACSIWFIFNRLRWIAVVETKTGDFRLNNNLTPFYARLAMHREPDLSGFFELRRADADGFDPATVTP